MVFYVTGYVVMPEHVHLLVSKAERALLSVALQMLKQNVAQKLAHDGRLWLPRYYDFNVWSEGKRIEKLRYIRRNPVTRGLVNRPEDWPWSSYRHYLTGAEGIVEIESLWTARNAKRQATSFGFGGQAHRKTPPCPFKKRTDKDGAPGNLHL